MSDTNSFILQTAEQRKLTGINGQYLHCFEATGLAEVHLIRKGKEPQIHQMSKGTTLNSRDFDTLLIVNKHGSANTLRFFYGVGDYLTLLDGATVSVDDTDPINVNISSGNVTVNNSQPNDLVSIADATVGATSSIIAAANSNSLFVRMTIPDSETFGIRYGDATVATNKGQWLGPGMSVELNISNHAVHAIRESSATSDVLLTINRLDKV